MGGRKHFFCQGGINALPKCGDDDDFRKLAGRFFPTPPESQHRLFRGCWREANNAVRTALQKPIKKTALLLVSRKTLTRQELDDTWQKVHLEMPDASIAVRRVLDEIGLCH